ncbi:hypothetical protein [Mycolicibacterium fortuitum]|uniref:hypothetical protein n=1 Tax=Mycolicibacterium fortuitum TaxID=1766 RepID=UPI00096CEB18|nr:hypothetical protein [Mycolicibacterium fortuitum]OMC08530.1 hypothetical protein A5734_01725 [Mycolicibacterium fortuitum]
MAEADVDDTRPMAEFSIPERIERWRKYAREEARVAQKSADDNPQEAMLAASLATMYLTLAADAHRFGELPEIPDDDEPDDEGE